MRKSAKDLLETSDEDMTNLKSQLLDLTTRWDNVNQLNSNKDARLQVQIRRGWPSDYPKTKKKPVISAIVNSVFLFEWTVDCHCSHKKTVIY